MSQQKLANVARMGDDTASTAQLQAKKTALQSAITSLDSISIASHFAGTDTGARISALQASMRSIISEVLESVTHRLAGTGPFTSP